MLWVQLHPYTTAALAAGFIMLFGAAVVLERASVAPVDTSNTAAWATGDRGYFAAPTSANPNTAYRPAPALNQDTKSLSYISPFATTTTSLASHNDDTPPDLDTLLATLSHATPAKPGTTAPKTSYDFIPTGLISVSNLEIESPAMTDNALRAELRIHGNTVGAAIQNFESLHPSQANILKDHAEAPYDVTKVRALDQLGQDYVALGDSLAQIDPVPKEIQAAHTKLIASYRNLGTKLSAVSKSPDTLIESIETYNASADQFAKDFVAFALIFPAYGVKFMQGEAGAAFQFTGSGGL